MTKLQTYKPMLKIVCYDDEVYFVEAKHKDSLIFKINRDRFIEIRGEVIATRNIKRIAPHDGMGHEYLPKAERVKVDKMIEDYRKNLGEEPTAENIKVMITKLTP